MLYYYIDCTINIKQLFIFTTDINKYKNVTLLSVEYYNGLIYEFTGNNHIILEYKKNARFICSLKLKLWENKFFIVCRCDDFCRSVRISIYKCFRNLFLTFWIPSKFKRCNIVMYPCNKFIFK